MIGFGSLKHECGYAIVATSCSRRRSVVVVIIILKMRMVIMMIRVVSVE